MIDPAFFETYPLYRKTNYDGTPRYSDLLAELPRLTLPCGTCNSAQTFTPIGIGEHQRPNTVEQPQAIVINTPEGPPTPHPPTRIPIVDGTVSAVHYVCARCNTARYCFVFRIDDGHKTIQKVGQYPPWSIEPPTAVGKALGAHLPIYKKGLICESQGFGIGAFAYYRRIIEDIIGGLLGDIGQLLKDDPKHGEYMAKLETVRDSRAAEARIDVVKDLLPPILRPSGLNPLAIMHSALSDGLHSQSDEDCLAYAEALRASFVFLIEQLSALSQSTTGYQASIEKVKKVLDKRGKTRTDPT